MSEVYINVNGAVVKQDSVETPKNRRFRSNWTLEGDVITVDMDKAKEQVRNELRVERAPLMEDNDLKLTLLFRKKELYNGATLSEEDKAKGLAIEADQQRLRDVTKHPDIDACQTPEDLENLKLL